MNIRQHVVALTSGTRVFVNGTEVTKAPSTVPIEVEVVEPLPPLPMVEAPAFTERPVCSKCRSRQISWTYWAGYHQANLYMSYDPSAACTLNVRLPYVGYSYEESQAVREARYAKQRQITDTVPPHFELTCDRCSHRWAMAVAPELPR